MEMCVPFTIFERSVQFQAIHAHILNFGVQSRTHRAANGLALNGTHFLIACADQELKLQESDILGAELPKPPEYCTIAILKRWLACQGAKLSRKRKRFDRNVSEIVVHTTFTY